MGNVEMWNIHKLKKVKKRYQQILEVEILLQTFGISSIYYFGDNRYKCGLLSKHLFQIMQ